MASEFVFFVDGTRRDFEIFKTKRRKIMSGLEELGHLSVDRTKLTFSSRDQARSGGADGGKKSERKTSRSISVLLEYE